MTQEDSLSWLQQWYAQHTNGDWEHSYGIDIETLDNPGWSVKIELSETPLADKPFETVKYDGEDHDNDWYFCRVQDRIFEAVGDPGKLTKLLEIFRLWATSANDQAH